MLYFHLDLSFTDLPQECDPPERIHFVHPPKLKEEETKNDAR